MEENKFNGSAPAGSPEVTSVPNPNSFGGATGETLKAEAPQIDPVQHKELESLVGRQGTELGEYRKFISDISPLLDKLNNSPEIVQAIIDGNITTDLAKAAMEGKVTISDAQIVNKAAEEVKKDLGKEYKGASPEEISKLIEDKAKEIKGDLQKELKERDDLSAFESSVNDFISRTADFPKYAKEIDTWLDEHDVTDIAVAYYAVKGELSEKEARKQAEIDQAEAEKAGALNMGGGSGNATHRISADSNMIDSLISNKANPNSF
ncbi:MAG: hypothetical protein WC917_02520 [Bacilli bacterium]|jgi:hypothetical protein